MTKKLPPHEKVTRKPIQRACEFCHTKHLQCDSSRPCKNCTKRGVADQCHDVERKRIKYMRKGKAAADTSSTAVSNTAAPLSSSAGEESRSQTPNGIAETAQRIPTVSASTTPAASASASASASTSFALRENSVFGDIPAETTPAFTPPHIAARNPRTAQSQHQSLPQVHNKPPHQQQQQRSMNSTVDSPDVFSSLFANQEYAQLTDLLDADSAKSPSQSSVIYNTEFQTAFQTDTNTRPYISLSDNSTNTSNAVPNLMLSAYAPDYTSPLILRHLIKCPEDVYTSNLQPYNYPRAYHALLDYLRKRFNKEQLMSIAETMAAYRPSFIAATRSLVEMDLLFAERSFQRSLLEYESMSSLSSSPTIMWRRTGEIVAVSTEFSSLTSHTKTELLSKRTFIIELMNDGSALDYFRLFSSVAFGDLNGVIITECTLLSPSGEPIRCASTWTVKRDVFDIPMLIVGQFLPILQVK